MYTIYVKIYLAKQILGAGYLHPIFLTERFISLFFKQRFFFKWGIPVTMKRFLTQEPV